MIRICIVHNQIDYGRGWKKEEEDVCVLAKAHSRLIAISPCIDCIKAENKTRIFFKEGQQCDE
jgi:hypothetical protein